MDAGLLLQYAIVAVAVLASAGYVLRSRAPRLVRRLRIALAIALLREGRPGWMRRLGRVIAPPAALASGECGGCDGCR